MSKKNNYCNTFHVFSPFQSKIKRLSCIMNWMELTCFAFQKLFLYMAKFIRLDDTSRKKMLCSLCSYRTTGNHLQTPSNNLKNNSYFLMSPLESDSS